MGRWVFHSGYDEMTRCQADGIITGSKLVCGAHSCWRISWKKVEGRRNQMAAVMLTRSGTRLRSAGDEINKMKSEGGRGITAMWKRRRKSVGYAPDVLEGEVFGEGEVYARHRRGG